jgi:hypothetical protein
MEIILYAPYYLIYTCTHIYGRPIMYIKYFCMPHQNIGMNGTEYFISVVAYDIKYK